MGDIDTAAQKAILDSALWWADASTIAVTVGVAIEFLALFIFNKSMPPLEKAVMIFATLLIVVGCGGEFLYGDRASGAADQLRQASDQKIAGLTKEAEDLRKSNIVAQKDLEQERKERLELQAKFAWRNLNEEQRAKIAAAIHPFAGVAYDTAISNEVESQNLLTQIEAALDAAGWIKKHCNCAGPAYRDAQGRGTSVTVMAVNVGIFYDATKEAEFGAASTALAKALTANGVVAIAASVDQGQVTADNIHLRVGSKPQ